MTTLKSSGKKRWSGAQTVSRSSIDLGGGIVLRRFKKGASQKRKQPGSGSGFQVHVTSNSSGVPKTELYLSSIGGALNRINLNDLEDLSKKIREIMRHLNLEQGDYEFCSTATGTKAIIQKLRNARLPDSPTSATASQPSRKEIVEGEIEEAYSAKEVAEMLHISPQAVQKKRHTHALLGLKVANRFVYPKWQFDAYGQVIPGLTNVLKHLFSAEDNTLEIAARLNDRRPFLEGRSIKNCLIDGRIDDAEMAAENLSALRV